MRASENRAGITLTEVLIAIFVTAVGLLSILTLFPTGMQSMAQAVQDTRVGHAKENAVAIAYALDMRSDRFVTRAFTNPGGSLPPLGRNDSGASYAVFVDPYGVAAHPPGNPLRDWVAGDTTGVPRVTLSDLQTGTNVRQRITEMTTFLDDIDFAKQGGRAGQPTTTTVERGLQYSWAWLLQRPKVNTTSIVHLSVVVYKGRSLQIGAGNQASGETTYQAVFNGGQPLIAISWNPANQPKPDIKTGAWILDSSMQGNKRYGQFYRVVSAREEPNNQMILEVQNPIFNYGGSDQAQNRNGKVVIMKNVVDVFDKGVIDQ